jgi:hypothetical protein
MLRTQDMSGVDERRVHAGSDLKDLGIGSGPAEIVETVQRIEGRIERLFCVTTCSAVTGPAGTASYLLLHEVGRIEKDKPRQFTRS